MGPNSYRVRSVQGAFFVIRMSVTCTPFMIWKSWCINSLICMLFLHINMQIFANKRDMWISYVCKYLQSPWIENSIEWVSRLNLDLVMSHDLGCVQPNLAECCLSYASSSSPTSSSSDSKFLSKPKSHHQTLKPHPWSKSPIQSPTVKTLIPFSLTPPWKPTPLILAATPLLRTQLRHFSFKYNYLRTSISLLLGKMCGPTAFSADQLQTPI